MKATCRTTYRAWVDAGARGFFLARSVAVNAIRLVNPADRGGGFFVRRDLSDPAQGGPRERAGLQLRTRLHYAERDRPEWDGQHPNWIVTARVERPAEVVRRGWLTWDTVGDVIEPASKREEA